MKKSKIFGNRSSSEACAGCIHMGGSWKGKPEWYKRKRKAIPEQAVGALSLARD
jgi:hypothetical protein